MDRVRLGRVLGAGARMAAKTLVSAVDAATAPNPTARPEANGSGAPVPADAARPVAGEVMAPVRRVESDRRRGRAEEMAAGAARKAEAARSKGRDLKEGGRRFGEAVWGPVVKLSGVLWLEVTGVFFGLFAMSAGVGAWKMWSASRGMPAGREAQTHLAITAAVALVFGYFCATSFARARRRGRGR